MSLKNLVLLSSLSLSLISGSASATLLWVGDSNGNLGTVDTVSGNVNVIGNMGVTMTDIAFDSSGNLFGISFTDLYSIDASTATTSLIGSHSLSSTAKNSLVFGADGTLYAANDSLFSLNTSTGASTLIGNGGDSYDSSGDLAFIGAELFLSSTGGTGGDKLVQLDTANGVGSDVGDIGYSGVYGLATDNNVDLYGVAGTSVLSISTLTGVGSELLDYSGYGLGIAWGSAFYAEAGASVPEPSILALMSIGLIGLGFVGRKNKQA